MHLRRVVGGLLTRDPVLSTLLLNYADRLARGRLGPGADPRFVVPSWTDPVPEKPDETRVLTIAAHTCRDDPSPHDHLDAVLGLLHGVLTGEEARRSITTRYRGTSADLQAGVDTVAKVATWEITLTPSQAPVEGGPRTRAVPGPPHGARSRSPGTGNGRHQSIGDRDAAGLSPASEAGSSSR
jgi:hypothetical protein